MEQIIMKKFLILLYLIFSTFSFAKQIKIDFHFDIDSGTIYYSNADIDSIGNLTSFNFNKKDVKISLKEGIYIFGFYDKKDRYLFKKINITHDRSFNISFIPQKTISINGNISENKKPKKNIQITFIDSMGREYYTTSSSKGDYSINLPPENYSLISSQFGYEISNKIKNFDFSQPNNSYTIPISIKKSLGYVKGKVLKENGHPISRAEITFSINKENKIIYSDKNGNFDIPFKEGIISMKISKEGYNSKGFIESFSRKNIISLKTFTLSKKIYFISGTISNNILPIRGQEIYLFSNNGTLLKKSITNENGNFKFLNIKNKNVYIYIPESDKYHEYKSALITTKENISNMIIHLEKK